MTRRVALLRGPNVGSSTRVPMGELRSIVESLGGTDVVTYVNSGNVVYTGELTGDVARRIHDRFGVTTSVVTLDAATFDRVVDEMPFTGDDHAKLGVVFMSTVPDSVDEPANLAPERLHLGTHAMYLDLPDGFAASKLTPAWYRKQLPPDATSRNWRTVLKLQQLLHG